MSTYQYLYNFYTEILPVPVSVYKPNERNNCRYVLLHIWLRRNKIPMEFKYSSISLKHGSLWFMVYISYNWCFFSCLLVGFLLPHKFRMDGRDNLPHRNYFARETVIVKLKQIIKCNKPKSSKLKEQHKNHFQAHAFAKTDDIILLWSNIPKNKRSQWFDCAYEFCVNIDGNGAAERSF